MGLLLLAIVVGLGWLMLTVRAHRTHKRPRAFTADQPRELWCICGRSWGTACWSPAEAWLTLLIHHRSLKHRVWKSAWNDGALLTAIARNERH